MSLPCMGEGRKEKVKMMYRAIYEFTPEVKKEILRAIREDDWYPMYNPHYGTGLWYREVEGMSWGDYIFIPTRTGFVSTDEVEWDDLIRGGVKKVRWLTSGGNFASVHLLNKDRCLFTVKSRRHGIPMYLAPVFVGKEPLEVLCYETYCPHWKWWETLDNHSEDRGWLSELFKDSKEEGEDR